MEENQIMDVSSANTVLAISKPMYTTNTKVKQKILEEEEYLLILDKLVERDFFPELSKLKLRNEYLDALETNDLEKLRTIQLRLEKKTPFESNCPTPCIDSESILDNEEHKSIISDDNKTIVSNDISLDKFLQKHTSEDNASFEDIMEVTRKKHREKFAWLYVQAKEKNERQQAALTLPESYSAHLKALENKSNNLDTWKYVARNALMYTPDGVDLSVEEYIENKGKKEQVIDHKNTRFQEHPFDGYVNQMALNKAAQEKASLQKACGKIGIDGKLEQPDDTAIVNGYEMVATPSPAPGVDASPFMTWGQIDGTPINIDKGGMTPIHDQGRKFKMPAPPKREQLAHSLAEKASKQHREKRKKAFAAATASLFSPKNTPRSNLLAAERLTRLSPAAQKLMKSSVRVNTDKSLRSSYSPSPRYLSDSIRRTPSARNTPGSSRRRTGPTTPSAEKTPHTDSSLTDGLLKLPAE